MLLQTGQDFKQGAGLKVSMYAYMIIFLVVRYQRYDLLPFNIVQLLNIFFNQFGVYSLPILFLVERPMCTVAPWLV